MAAGWSSRPAAAGCVVSTCRPSPRDGRKSAETLTYSGCGRYLAVADVAGVVRVFEAEEGTDIFSLDWGQGEEKSRAKVRVLALSPGGEMLAIGGTRRTITVVERTGS